MSSETTSSLVLFIAAIAIAGIAAGAMATVVGSVANELRDRGNSLADSVATDLAIVNDPDNVPYDDAANELTLYVKNTGEVRLTSEELFILVDGQHATFNATVLGTETEWKPGTVLEATVSVDLATGDHRARLTYNTVSDKLEFRV